MRVNKPTQSSQENLGPGVPGKAHRVRGEERVEPVIRERLEVGKRQVETARVRVKKSVHEHKQVVDEPLFREEIRVEHVPVNRMVERMSEARQEGQVLIIPVYEEVLVTEKRLMLKEELHIKREQREFHEPREYTLRSQEVEVEHEPPSPAPAQDKPKR